LTWGSCWKKTEKISAWFLAGSGAESLERSRLLLSPCLLPGGVSPVGDIALRTPAGARCPPSVRRLRPLPDGRAVGARGAAERGASDQTRKSSKGESAQTWIASARSRISGHLDERGCCVSPALTLVPPPLLLPLLWPFFHRGFTWTGTSSAHLMVG
jgi:hypothetical protein